mgnify:CR=1 FL=1
MPNITIGKKKVARINPPMIPPLARAKSTSSHVRPFISKDDNGMITKIYAAAPRSKVTAGTRKSSIAAGTTFLNRLSMTVNSQAVIMTPMTPPSPG